MKTAALRRTDKSQSRKESYWARLKKNVVQNKGLYIMLIPVVAYYLIFHYEPMYGLQIAFKDFSFKKGILGSPWVGLKHFQDFFGSYYFWRLLGNTLRISISNLLWGFPAPIILAIMINEVRNVRFKKTVQTLTYLPHFISVVVVCGMIKDFLALDGPVNAILQSFGMEPINFFAHGEYFTTIFVASDKLRQIFSITLPSIMPTVVIMFILRVGKVLSLGSEKIMLLYNPTIYEYADVISTFVYRKGLEDANYSYAAAVGLFNAVVNFILLYSINRLSKKVSDSSLW